MVSAETNTGTLVMANPNGSFTLTETSSPVRIHRHGTWVPLDTQLSRRADGMIAPAATATGVAFSPGGRGPMAVLSQGRRRLSFFFPAVLPAPLLSGATAVYRDVLPSVDLRLTADASGFSEILVVKDRAAAADPGLARLTLVLRSSGVRVVSRPGGTAAALTSDGAAVFHSDPPMMWDSSAATPAGRDSAGRADLATAGSAVVMGGHVAQFAVTTRGTEQTLVPDRSLLTAPTTKFPVFIDPVWSGNPSQLHWARISSNGWNIYDSTSTAGGDLPRVGFDNWPGGAGEVARTYYQMNTGGTTGTSGIGGSIVTSATLYVNDNWAASDSATPVDVNLSCGPVSNGWNSTDLNWGNKPCEGTHQDERSSYETSSGVSPGTLAFNVTNAAQAAAAGPYSNLTFEVRSPNEGNALQWKQFAAGGGATISVTYMRPPDFAGGTGSPTITPSSAAAGKTFTTSPTPTLNITAEDTDGENVQTVYQIWAGNSASPTNLVSQGEGPSSGYALHGGPWTPGTSLPDGTYEWRASATNPITASNPQGLWTGWSAWHVFTVDTSVPSPPRVESPQFPVNHYGAAFSTPGTFTFSNDQTNNVMGYMFSVDGDLGTTVYNPASPPPTWTGSGTPVPGKLYWLAADNNDGTGNMAVNGYASAAITPGSTGPHRIFAKAVDEAGNTSAEYAYVLYAGVTNPTFVHGDQLVHGYTASDGTSVPAATWNTSNGAVLTTQPTCCGVKFADGAQAYLTYGPGAPALGDTATMHFYVPSTGYWDVGANLTKSQGYGQYSLTLDQGSTTYTPATLTSFFDAANTSGVSLSYQDFGIPKDSNGGPIQLKQGIHTLTLKILGTSAATGEYKAGIDVLRLAPAPASCSITDLSGCMNNTAISPDSNTSIGDFDGWGQSLSANALAAAGWTPGVALTVDGAPMAFPKYGNGVQDNVIPAGQTVTVPSTGYANDGDAIVFLGFSSNLANLTGYTGHITYTKSCTYGTSQSYTLDDVPAWNSGYPAPDATLALPYTNQYGNVQSTSSQPSIFAVAVPLDFPGCSVASVTLPVVSNGLSGTAPTMHIFALGIRSSSYVGATSTTVNTSQGSYPNLASWTAAYGARQDGVTGALGAVTVRMPVRVSRGNGGGGGQVRIHLANTEGSAPVTIDDASVATQSSGPVPTAAPVPVTFNGGSKSVTIPAGSEITADPVAYPVAQSSTLLVSVHLAAPVSKPPAALGSPGTTYLSAAGTDAVMDTTSAPFTSSGATTSADVPFLTGVDVTSTDNTAGSLVLYGDQTVNSDTASGGGASVAADLTTDLANASTSGTAPYSVVAEGANGASTSSNLLPQVFGSKTPLSALNPVDRSLMATANVRTVVISTGTADILNGEDASTIETRLAALAQQVRNFYADSPQNNPFSKLTVYVATVPPDSRFSAAEENVREAVNSAIFSQTSDGSYLDGNADGVIDFAAAVSSTGNDAGSTVAPKFLTSGQPNDAYFQALAQQYLTAINTTVNIPPDP